jgi:hypothetical protein
MTELDKVFIKYLRELKKSKPKAIDIFIKKTTKKLPKNIKPFYTQASKTVLTSLVVTELTSKEFKEARLQSKITLPKLAIYTTLATFVIPYANADNSGKRKIEQSLHELQQNLTLLLKPKTESYLSESFFDKPKALLKSATLNLFKSVAFFGGAALGTLHGVINLGFSYLDQIPGGSFLISMTLPFFVKLNYAPIVYGSIKIIKWLNSKEAGTIGSFAKSVGDGTFMNKVMEMVNELTKDIDFDLGDIGDIGDLGD